MLVRTAIAAAILAGCMTPAAAIAETVTTRPDSFELIAIADAFDKAQITQDRAALERMVSPSLIFIQSNGERAGKKVFIDGWMTPGDRYDPVKLTGRVIDWLGPDVFMVTAKATLSGISGGKRFTSSFQFTDTFQRIAGKWYVIHIQVTRAAD